MEKTKFSLLYPKGTEGYRRISDVTMHDLGMDTIIGKLSDKTQEQNVIMNIMTLMTADPEVSAYRLEIFDDIYEHPAMRERMMEILGKIDFLRDYGSFKREYDEGSASTWDLLHRLEEIRDYIRCVDAIAECLEGADLKSRGLLKLKDHIHELSTDHAFEDLKKDIEALKADTSCLRSVTVGINLNDRYEAESIGLISINDKAFTKAGVISNFAGRLMQSDKVQKGNAWNEEYRYQPFTADKEHIFETMEKYTAMRMTLANPLAAGLAGVPQGDSTADMTRYMDHIVNHMLALTVKRLKEVLKKYVSVTITEITELIPEFMYYIRWAEYIRKLRDAGKVFSSATVNQTPGETAGTYARGIYNLKLALHTGDEEIVTNDLDFDREHLVYILTGANRGGKTTITQAVGQLFVLAQGGIYIPGDSFDFTPADCIYTHFPADEDKTMDLGRLGEECKRFREEFISATKDSLLLLNETFSTTSFEEGYYIARDSVKAIMMKGMRCIYNTHMHKLAFDVKELNAEAGKNLAQSLVVQSTDGKRSYKVVIAEPQGRSFAGDIAEKYGVTYEMLTGGI